MEMIPSSKLNIAVENGLFTDDFLLYHLYPWWFWIAMSNYSRLNTPFIVVIVHLPVKASMCLHMPPFIDMWNKSYLISLAKSANSTDESMGNSRWIQMSTTRTVLWHGHSHTAFGDLPGNMWKSLLAMFFGNVLSEFLDMWHLKWL